MYHWQQHVNEQLLSLQSRQNSKLDSRAHDVTRHLDEAPASLDRQASEQIRRMGNRLDRHQIRNWLTTTIPTCVPTSDIPYMIPHYIH